MGVWDRAAVGRLNLAVLEVSDCFHCMMDSLCSSSALFVKDVQRKGAGKNTIMQCIIVVLHLTSVVRMAANQAVKKVPGIRG